MKSVLAALPPGSEIILNQVDLVVQLSDESPGLINQRL